MGYGDVLMTMGEAKRLHQQTGKKICLPRRYCPELYEGIDYITDDPSKADIVLQDPFPATDQSRSTELNTCFRKYKPYPADLKLPDFDASRLGDFIFIEPHTKTMTSKNNRDWGWENFCELVRRVKFRFVQPAYGLPILPGAVPVMSDFLGGIAVLKKARTAVMAEGGMMHAAAAVNVPSVVIFGGYVSPENTGYDLHTNLFTGGEPCGSKYPCPHCREAMRRITVDQVVAAVEEKLAAARA
jgi:ADP-heptose:LPS heptosyltransferase